jgi:uncharacterized cysteine cluster protein YcgN (CxxCxxCC family)
MARSFHNPDQDGELPACIIERLYERTMSAHETPFWRSKKLSEMTLEEWESLCDHCGRCCLNKLEDEETGEILFTNIACNLLDTDSCRCTQYAQRCQRVPDCIDLRSARFNQYHWLPSSCAYRRLAEGSDLPSWHPLVTGDSRSVRDAGISVGSYAIKESEAGELTQHVIEWLT